MTKRLLKRILRLCIAVSICGTGGLYAYDFWQAGRFVVRTENAYVRSGIVAVAPKVPGYVVEVAVDDNQRVAAGDLLFRIGAADFEARLAQSRAALEAARAARIALNEQHALQDALITEARAGLRAAQAEAGRAGRDRARASALIRDGWTTAQRHDTVIAMETRASASVEQAEARLAAQHRRLSVLKAEAARLDAVAEQAAAQVRLAEIALDDTTVRAPISGFVGNRHVEIGRYARPGAPLLSIVPLHEVWVIANVKETQLRHITPGQTVTVRVDSLGGPEIAGRVDSFAPASGAEFSLLPPDNATGNFVRVVQRIPIKILLDHQNDAVDGLRPGMSARVAIHTRGADAGDMPTLLDMARALVAEQAPEAPTRAIR